jgi:hypothetical protein
MGENLMMTVILGAVFVALVLWVAVRLHSPRRREDDQRNRPEPGPAATARPERTATAESEPVPAELETQAAAALTPRPEIDSDIVAAAESEGMEAVLQPAAAPQVETPHQPQPAEEIAPETPVPIALQPEVEPQRQAATAVQPEPEPPPALQAASVPVGAPAAKKKPARAKKPAGAGRKVRPPEVPVLLQDAYRHIRTWTTSLTPGRSVPAILSDARVERGEPTTYRFILRDRPYSIVKTDLTEPGDGAGPLLHEQIRLLDGEGGTLCEMALVTADIGSDETPGEVTAFAEGPWLDDFRELNALSSKDAPRIGTDFRKKFRAKEQVRLKRDFGV